jgi:hypothetical protein
MSYTPLCAICNVPVNLEESKTDECGHAVHENCYVWTVELKKPERRMTKIDAHLRHLCSEPAALSRRDLEAVCFPCR